MVNAVEAALSIEGWLTEVEMLDLYSLARDATTIVEIGSWKGRSAALLASASLATVYCIDHWRGNPESTLTDEAQRDPLGVYRQFLDSMRDLGLLGSRVIPMLVSSDQAALYFQDDSVNLVYLDGGHDYHAVACDLSAWWPKVSPGGVLCGHDYGSAPFPGVKSAVDEFVGRTRVAFRRCSDSLYTLRAEGPERYA